VDRGSGIRAGHAFLSGLTFGIESVYFIYTVTFLYFALSGHPGVNFSLSDAMSRNHAFSQFAGCS
jgi:hypothetical protein